MFKRIVALFLTISITIISTACGVATDSAAFSKEKAVGSQLGKTVRWIDSDISGSITEDDDIRLQDDFSAAANKEWKIQMGDTFYEIVNEIKSKLEA